MYRVWSENPSGNARSFFVKGFLFFVVVVVVVAVVVVVVVFVKTRGPCLRISGKKATH